MSTTLDFSLYTDGESNASWPGGPETPDKTYWQYQAATGLCADSRSLFLFASTVAFVTVCILLRLWEGRNLRFATGINGHKTYPSFVGSRVAIITSN